jgi:hypothetical protein
MPKRRVPPIERTCFGDTKARTMPGNRVENKGFSTALILRLGSTILFGHASAARDANPNEERKFVTHVEADESAYDPWPASRAGASNHV